MEKVCANRKCLLVMLTLFFVNTMALAQNEPPDFITIIQGSEHPELIESVSVYHSISTLVLDTSPGRCAPDQPGKQDRISSTAAPCTAPVPGVDADDMLQLAKEFLLRQRVTDQRALNFCGENSESISRMTIAEFATYMDNAIETSNAGNAAFFESRAQNLLGAEGYEKLMAYANNMRTRMSSSVTDTRKMMETTGMTPAFMVEQACSREAAP